MDDYEADEKFTLEYVEPDKAIFVNRNVNHDRKEMTRWAAMVTNSLATSRFSSSRWAIQARYWSSRFWFAEKIACPCFLQENLL